MVEFSAGAVLTMLAIVEATVAGMGYYIVSRTPTEEDVSDVEETAESAAEKARELKYEVAKAHKRIDRRIADQDDA